MTPPRKEPGPSAHKPVSDSVAETLANAICGDLLGDPDSFTSFDEQRPIPPPTVAPVPSLAELERVTSNMDPETAHKLIASGAALEGLASLCFFNPMWKQILGKGR